MGLPVWRDPDEELEKQKQQAKDALKQDPTARSRSSIRRRASVHGRRDGARPYSFHPRLPRESSYHASTASPYNIGSWAASSVSDIREAARNHSRGVPPVSVLLESADRNAPLPPPPVPESHNYLESETGRRARRLARRNDRYTPAGRITPTPQDFRNWTPSARRAWIEEHLAPLRYRLRRPDAEAGIDRFQPDSQEAERQRAPQQNLLEVVETQPRFFRSPEPLIDLDEADSRPPQADRRGHLHHASDNSVENGTSRPLANRRLHPLSNSWRPESPISGLGDRNRSPTPADGWEIMRSTIEPDRNLPSADSSFTSAAASNSFSSTGGTTITHSTTDSENEPTRPANDSVSVSSVDADDLVCADDEDIESSIEAFAEDVYFHEMAYPEGRDRVSEEVVRREAEGTRFAPQHESDRVDIGFHLIERAINSEEGRRRLSSIRADISFENAAHVTRARRSTANTANTASSGRRRTRIRDTIMDDEAPELLRTTHRALTPLPAVNEHSTSTSTRTRSPSLSDSDWDNTNRHQRSLARRGTHHRANTSPSRRNRAQHRTRPYIPATELRTGAMISDSPPQPHAVSPPSRRSEREISDALLTGDLSRPDGLNEDEESIRRVVERLAQRDEVPDEWWMSMGLNLQSSGASRTRPRAVEGREDGFVDGPVLERVETREDIGRGMHRDARL